MSRSGSDQKGSKKRKKPEPTNDDSDDDIAPSMFLTTQKDRNIRSGDECPYLDTINRKTVDFDFEKVCSVSMTKHNVYCCLVCGAYFNGRSKDTHAYYHALHEKHHIFIHLQNGKIYCLPDSYEVDDPSLADIKHNLHPSYSRREISRLDEKAEYSHALDKTNFLPGMIGINNLGHTEWLNAVAQSLLVIKPLRNFFIDEKNYKDCDSPLVTSFGEFIRKFFNTRAFKGQISPHELLEAVRDGSDKKYSIGTRSDAKGFCTWFLNSLHKELGGTKKRASSIINRVFQGRVIINTVKDEKGGKKGKKLKAGVKVGIKEVPFSSLTLQLPQAPLFKSEDEQQFIPQVPMIDLLKKFDGETIEALPGALRTYSLVRLPPYLIVHMKRFQENNFYVEKNPTIVNFPIKNLDFAEYVIKPDILRKMYSGLKIDGLKKRLRAKKVDISKCIEKRDLIEKLVDAQTYPKRTRYNLVANIVHGGEWAKGTNKAFVYHRASQQWYETQDLHIAETMPQLVAVSESYIQVWELQKD